MNTNTQKSNIGKIIYILAAVGLLLAFVVFALEKQQIINLYTKPTGNFGTPLAENPGPPNLQPNEAEKNLETKIQSDQKSQFIDSTDINGNPLNPQPPSSSNIEILTSQENNNIIIKTKLTNIDDGICILNITNGSQKYSENADVIYLPEYSTCAGFSLLKDKLGAGNWQINLEVKPINGDTINKDTSYEVI